MYRDAEIISIIDPHNALKTHYFKVYSCRHAYYNQGRTGGRYKSTNGQFRPYFYPKFVRATPQSNCYYWLYVQYKLQQANDLMWSAKSQRAIEAAAKKVKRLGKYLETLTK